LYKEKINWVEHIHYPDEDERGEAAVDDCFQSGYFQTQIPAKTEKQFAVATAVSPESKKAEKILNSIGSTYNEIRETLEFERDQLNNLLTNFFQLHPQTPMRDWLNWILLAADSFIVKDLKENKSVIAGYHWFEPWGRDTFISLPGLMLVTGRFSEAKDILQNYITYCKNGLIPNFIADRTGLPVYDTVDATFWYVNAVLQYVKYTGDFAFVHDELWEKLQSIIENHQKGTWYGIQVDNDGLLMHGPRLTWMDAMVEGHEITPRAGKAVEIQALWYNTLRTMEFLARKFVESELAEKYHDMAQKTIKSFNAKFWNPTLDCLYDVIGSGAADGSLRPNQIFAVSLDFTMLDEERSNKVVELVNHELATPFGLRTLAFSDPKFVGKCYGNERNRDTAYHNGTIWPWLLGPYVTAYLKVNNYSNEARIYALNNWIMPLFNVGIHQGGLGTINEIYDCDPPNAPRGCISQAWSVAEPLRAYIENVLMVKPLYAKEILGI
jgi:predicted glycogen debranching enzyme